MTERKNGGVALPYLEIPVVKHCNLKCKRCSHLANVEEPWEISIADLTRSVLRLKELFPEIGVIRLLGGEPLLHSNLVALAKTVRESYPSAQIKVVTNGLLLLKTPDEVLDGLSALKVFFDVSAYPPTLKIKEKLEERFYKHGIIFEISEPIVEFQRRLLPAPLSNAQKAWQSCPSKACYILSGGSISYCCVPQLEGHANRFFGMDMRVEDSRANIFEEKWTGEKLLEFLNAPHSCCRYCGVPEKIEWTVTGAPAPEDWLVQEPIK